MFGELEGVKKDVILLFDVAFECKCLRKRKSKGYLIIIILFNKLK